MSASRSGVREMPYSSASGLLVDPGAGRQFVGEDAGAQTFGHLFVQGGGARLWRVLSCIHNYGYSIMLRWSDVNAIHT